MTEKNTGPCFRPGHTSPLVSSSAATLPHPPITTSVPAVNWPCKDSMPVVLPNQSPVCGLDDTRQPRLTFPASSSFMAMQDHGIHGRHLTPMSSADPSQAPVALDVAKLVHNHDVQAFVGRWGLNLDCSAIVQSLPMRVQREVFRDFHAHPSTRDVSSKFMSWISSKMNEWSGIQSCLATTLHERNAFYSFWKLDAKCREIIEEQPPHIQRELVSNFKPPAGTTNVAGRLTSFLNMLLKKKELHHARSGKRLPSDQFKGDQVLR